MPFAAPRVALAPVLLVLGLAMSGCTAEDPAASAMATVTPDGPVLQPGRPGEANTTHTGPITVPAPQHNDADARFMAEMIIHHSQAIEMVERSREGLQDEQVRSLAARIEAAQGPELQAMATWLVQHDRPVPQEAVDAGVDVARMGGQVARAVDGGAGTAGSGHAGHGSDHADMPGMASPAELEDLAAARGREADLLFLDLMTRHHEGALEMAEAHGAEGIDIRAVEMSTDVHVEQSVEIDRMAEIRERFAG